MSDPTLHSQELRQVAENIFSGITPKSGGDAYTDEQNGIRFIRSGEITEEGLVEEQGEVFLKPEIHNGIMRRSQLKETDLLIAIVGATIGKVGIYNLKTPANINQAIAAVRLDSKCVISEFASLFLMTNVGQSILDYLKRPVARANINLEEVGDIVLPIPSLDFQRKLVAEIQLAREQRRQKLQQSIELLMGIDSFILNRLGLVPAPEVGRMTFGVKLATIKGRRIDALAYRPFYEKGHPPKTATCALRELADISPHNVPAPSDENELVPYVGLPECNLTEVREVVMRPYFEVRGRRVIFPGDILFARIEPSVFNKKYVFVEDLHGHDHAYTSTEFYNIRAKEHVNFLYLYSMFFCSFVFSQVKGKTTGSSGRRRIDPDLFASLQIPNPSRKIQDEIAQEFSRRKNISRKLCQEAKRDWERAKMWFETQLLGEGITT